MASIRPGARGARGSGTARLSALPTGASPGFGIGGTVATGGRIGVDYSGEAATWPLRFAIAGHRHMSRPRL